jgi:predicted dehydrogenase/nucleoside-diphosphate-sugar epimerase
MNRSRAQVEPPGAPEAGTRFRTGIVGAGMISDHHVAALRALSNAELVGIHDADPQRAEARAAQWSTTAFESLEALVATGVDVVHVLTPPSTHAGVATEALDLGCHVLIEKPLADTVEDAQRVSAKAAETGLVATVNHSLLYDPQVAAALEQVRAGAIGHVVAVDVFRTSSYPPYEGGALPPHMRDAAYPWRDLGVHCLYLIRELLGEIQDVEARWRSLGGEPNLAFDEWRALVPCERGVGQFQLSWNAQPPESQLLIHGSSGTLRVDLFAMYRTRRAATGLPKAAERIVNAYAESLRPIGEVPVNAWRFARGEIRPYQGVRNLISDFYARLAAGQPPPVAIEDAIVIVDWLERTARAAEAERSRDLDRYSSSPKAEFLVTGASGSLGSAVVRRLLDEGRSVRAFVRRIPEQPLPGLEYVFGNLGDPDAVDRAVRGSEVVVHAGAAMSGPWPEHLGATVVGSRNIIDACRRFEVSQLVHVSSLSVVHRGDGTDLIDEETALEPRAELRGAYTQAKLEAERAVSTAAAEGLACVILRPGLIFGQGIPLLSPAIARRVGSRWVVLGDGRLPVPLVYISDVVDAILAAVERGLVGGEVIQLIDDERLTQGEVLALAGIDRKVLRLPRAALMLAGGLSEYPLAKLGRHSPIGRYRLSSAMSEAEFASDRARLLLGWTPRVGVLAGIEREVGSASQ